MSLLEETLRQLSREDGRALAEIGVRPGDERWIAEHAGTIASLAGGEGRGSRHRIGLFSIVYRLARLARRAARTAR
jgi:hypothetical protein